MNPPELEKNPHAIVIGIDYSALGDLALERACGQCLAHRTAHLHVVHAVNSDILRSHGVGAFGSQDEAQAADLKQASARLHEHVEQVVRRWCEAHSCQPPFERLTTHIRFKPAAEAIAQLAVDIDAELVIVGTHGRRGARRFLLGSVSEGTMRLAPCDVLVVRPPDAIIPQIEPACPRCVETRQATNGRELWCEQHRQHHERRHTYHFSPAPLSHQSSFLIHVK